MKKNISLCGLLFLTIQNIFTQDVSNIYPYGDKFLLGFYDVRVDFDSISSKGWNGTHTYEPNFNSNSINNLNVQNDYFDICNDNDLNVFPRLSAKSVLIEHPSCSIGMSVNLSCYRRIPKDSVVTKSEINHQKLHLNLSLWDITEECRNNEITIKPNVDSYGNSIFSVNEFEIVKEYPSLIRREDDKRRPVGMFFPSSIRSNQIKEYVPYLDVFIVASYSEHQRGIDENNNIIEDQIPHSFLRWKIDEFKEAIIDSNGLELDKDYLNGDKTIFTAIELFYRNSDNFTTIPEKTWHDFWLALSCDVKGIMVYSYRHATTSENAITPPSNLVRNLDTLHHAVSIFKYNKLGKVLLQGKEDVDVSSVFISPNIHNDSTLLFYYEPDSGAFGPTPPKVHYPSVKLLSKIWRGNTYVIAVNSVEDSVEFTIPFNTKIPISEPNPTLITHPITELITNNLLVWSPENNTRYNSLSGTYFGFINHTLPGYGAAVFKYKSTNKLDLYMKDCPTDNGYAAGYDQNTDNLNNSPDIWVRNNDDGLDSLEHQSPRYEVVNQIIDNTNYVYVRVSNMSSVVSSETDSLKLYWSKSGSAMGDWPTHWDGTHSDATMGGLIGTQVIPILLPDSGVVVEFQWNVIKDTSTTNGFTDWGHCLLAKIESDTDTIKDIFGAIPDQVFYNNNVSLKNCEVLPLPTWPNSSNTFMYPTVRQTVGKSLFVGNSSPFGSTKDIRFEIPKYFRLSSLKEDLKIKVEFDSVGWTLFSSVFEGNTDITIVGDKKIQLDKDEVLFENVYFPADVRVPIYVNFDFLMQEETEDRLEYVVFQQNSFADSLGNREEGLVRFVVKTTPRDPIYADGGPDKEIDRGESVTLCAELVNEAAIYNWYDMEGTLIYSGTNLTISPEVSEIYQLEIVAVSDGFSCYDAVGVEVHPYFITSVSPNPTVSDVIIEYTAEGASSSFVTIINQNTMASSNYPIDPLLLSKTINISSFPPGIYSVILVCDGVSYGSEILIIQ